MYKRTKIVCAAIRYKGVIYSLPPPNRHHHIIGEIVRLTQCTCVDNDEQGFLDESGTFLTRKQALISALQFGQVLNPDNVRCNMLFSEDLW